MILKENQGHLQSVIWCYAKILNMWIGLAVQWIVLLLWKECRSTCAFARASATSNHNHMRMTSLSHAHHSLGLHDDEDWRVKVEIGLQYFPVFKTLV